MSLDDVRLTDTLLQGLYNKSLYTSQQADTNIESDRITNLSFLGDNGKKIAVMVDSEDAIFLPDDELNFLLGILQACNLSMADVALINIHHNPSANYNTLANQLKTEKILLFGIGTESIDLPLQFPEYQIQKHGSQLYLSSASLKELQGNKEEKLKLWNSLKKIFIST